MRVWFLRSVAILLLGVAACSGRNEAPAPPASQKPAEVAAPPGLVGELTVPDPRRVWTALKKLGGSRADVLPSSFELALFGVLDLPPRVAGLVRADTPVVGVVLAPPGAAPVGLLAVRVARGSELVGALTRGDGPPLRVERDGSPVTLLVGSKPAPALGVVDDWLLVAGDVATLRAAGPYVARGLAARRMPDAPLAFEVNRAALTGTVVTSLREHWAALRAGLSAEAREARAERGRAADFGDPAAVLALADGVVGELVELVASSERLRFTLRPEAEHLELSLSMVPQANGALSRSLEALEVGGLEPLLELPSGVVLAALSRSSEAERAAAADKPADALRAVLGDRLAEKDAAPLADALRSFHRGRGAAGVAGVFADRSVFLRQEAREPKELERGLRGLLRMLRVPALSAPLEPLLGKVNPRESSTRVVGVEGPVHRVELVAPSARAAGTEALVHVRGAGASVVAAPKASAALLSLTAANGTLGQSPEVGGLSKGRVPAALAVYAELSPLKPAGGPAPALAAFGKQGGDALVEVALSAAACSLLLEHVGSP